MSYNGTVGDTIDSAFINLSFIVCMFSALRMEDRSVFGRYG